MEEALPLVTDLTWGVGADKVIATMGVGDGLLVESAMSLCAKGGRVVWTNIAGINETEVTLNLFNMSLQEKQLIGSIFGSANPRRDIPRLLKLYQEGKLKLDELITRTYPLSDINQGYQDMRDGKNIRGMVMYDHAH
jgi:S-(hydroxymethyl)glutathione dehydrogenase/alcohol dehydrogenase